MDFNYYSHLMPDIPEPPPFQFHYGDVKYKDFRKIYEVNPKDWVKLKLKAVPIALLCVVIAVCHVVLGIFTAILIVVLACDAARPLFKYASFAVIRDLQMVFGSIMSIFCLSLGRYHVLEAVTQKGIYVKALDGSRASSSCEDELPSDKRNTLEERSNAFKTLGLKSNATKSEIKKARDTLALKCHTDKNPDGLERIKAINNAFDILTDK